MHTEAVITIYVDIKAPFGGNRYDTTAQISEELERVFTESRCDLKLRGAHITLPTGVNATYTDF